LDAVNAEVEKISLAIDGVISYIATLTQPLTDATTPEEVISALEPLVTKLESIKPQS
jgi:hypothetical protein